MFFELIVEINFLRFSIFLGVVAPEDKKSIGIFIIKVSSSSIKLQDETYLMFFLFKKSSTICTSTDNS